MDIRKLTFAALMSCMASAMAFNAVLPDKAADSATPAGPAPFDLADPARIKLGQDRFQSTCADYCHGHKPALFVEREGLEAEYVFNTIRDGGRGATPMPPWGEVFTQEEIWELVAYIKSIGRW